MPKFSIITINLNNAEGLRKTIESVVSQSFTDFEYLIIDGESIDGSVDIIKQYADKITYWISEPDMGIYNAMNKGILKATGEYCLFLNSGDWLVENILEKLLDISFDIDIVYGNMYVDYENGLRTIRKGCNKEELSFYDFYNDTICHQAALIKKKLFSENGLYEEKYQIGSDWLFFMKTIIFGHAKTKYIDVAITHFEPYGISSKTNLNERKMILESLLPKQVLVDYENMDKQTFYIQKLQAELNQYKKRYTFIEKIIKMLNGMSKK